MFRELSATDFGSVVPMFPHKHELPAVAVLTRQFPGRVFWEDGGGGTATAAVVWVSGRWFYITGTVSSETKTNFDHFLKDVVVPMRRQEGWVEIYAPDDSQWDHLLLGVPVVAGVEKHYETTYTLDLQRFRAFLETGKALLDGARVIVTEQPTPPLGGSDDSHRRASLAAEVRRQETVLAACRDNGLRVGREYFVDVDTFDPSERQKGYATLAAMTLIRETLPNGDVPLWETTESNWASRRLANKLGFRPHEAYPVYAFTLLRDH